MSDIDEYLASFAPDFDYDPADRCPCGGSHEYQEIEAGPHLQVLVCASCNYHSFGFYPTERAI